MKQTLKRHAIRMVLGAIGLFKLGKLSPALAGRGVVFTLHHVRPKQSQSFAPNSHLEITPEFLEVAILAAKEAGLEPVRLEELPALLKSGDSNRKFVCFTLDDGYRNNAEFAAPVFRKHKVPYTIFICPGFVERTQILWWETAARILQETRTITLDFGQGIETLATTTNSQKSVAFARIAQMVEQLDENEAVSRIAVLATQIGIDPLDYVRHELMDADDLAELSKDPLCSLGGHTMTHCNLAKVDEKRLKFEIRESAARIMDCTGASISTFAYPYGWTRAAGNREFLTLAAEGYIAAVTTQPGTLSSKSLAAALPRISLNGHYQHRRYVEALISGLPFILI